MALISYAIKRLRKFNNVRFKKHMELIAKNNNKSVFAVECNYFINMLIYGVGYTDYFRGNYINLTKAEKETFVTSKSFYKILKKLNNEEDKKYLSDKIMFNKMFKEFIKRDFIDLREVGLDGLKKFFSEKKVVFAKPIDGFGGHDIEKLKWNENINVENIYNKLMEQKQYLIEEAIVQCDELNEINPYAVNSFRIVTLYNDGEVYIIGNALRVNQGKAEAVGCTEDLYFSLNEEGIIDSNVVDDYGNIYENHPLTKKSFKDVKVPYIKEAFDMCIASAKKLPRVRYIGWDVAITPKGPCLIEGNEYPGYGIIQFYKLKGSRTGHKKVIKDIIGNI